MANSDAEVSAALARINQRLYRLERHLNLPPLPAMTEPPVQKTTESPQLSVVPVAQVAPGVPTTPIGLEPPAPPSPVPSTLAATYGDLAPTSPSSLASELLERHSRTPDVRRPHPPARLPDANGANRPKATSSITEAWNLEKFIGARGFAAAGALIVVIGVALFVKLAYDNGWLTISETAKCLLGGGFGVLLLIAGEYLRRKVNAIASAGVSAAGIGTLYVSAYAAYAMFHLVSAPWAFGMLVAIAALGIGVGAVSGLVAVAAVSLIGGYLAPMLAGESHPGSLALPGYLLALLAVGLTLSYRVGRRIPQFYGLRSLVWWGTMVLGGLWCWHDGVDAWVGALAFLGITWFAFHAEILGSAGVRDKRVDAVLSEAGKDPHDIVRPMNWDSVGSMGIMESRPLVVSFSTTVWSVFLGTWLLRQAHPGLEWLVPAVGFASTLALAQSLIGHLTLLIEKPRTQLERQGAVLCLSAAGLLIATIALSLSGWPQFIAWLGLGVAGVAAGRWTGLRNLERYGLILLGINALRAFATYVNVPPPVLATTWGVPITAWNAMVAISGAAWLGAARVLLIRHGPESRPLATFAAIIGLILLNLAPCMGHTPGQFEFTAWCWLAIGVLTVASHFLESRLSLNYLGLAGLALAALGALSMGELVSSPPTLATVRGFQITTWTIMLAGVAAAWMGAARVMLLGKSQVPRAIAVTAAVVGLVLFNIAPAIGHQPQQMDAFTWCWLTIAVLAIAANFLESRLYLDYIGLACLALTAFGALTMGSVAPRPPALATVLGLQISSWTVLVALLGAAWLGAARMLLVRRQPGALPLAVTAAAIGVVLLDCAPVIGHLPAEMGAVAWSWLGIAVLVIAANFIESRLYLDYIGLGALALAALGWCLAYPLHGWNTFNGAPFLHPGLWFGVLFTVVIALHHFAVRGEGRSPGLTAHLKQTTYAAALLALLVATSFEIARTATVLVTDPTAKGAALSVYWAVYSIGLLMLGFWRKTPPIRYAGLALMAVGACKVVFIDMATVSQGWRIVSFIGLGLLMLGVAVGYAKLTKTLESVKDANDPEKADPVAGR